MNILIFIATLDCGGAERVATTLSKEWTIAGHDVELCRFSSMDTPPFYPIDQRVKLTSLDLNIESHSIVDAVSNNAKRVKCVRTVLKNRSPDIVLSFMLDTSVIVLLASIGLALPVIVSEHSDLESYPIGRVWSMLRRVTYKRVTQLVVLNKSIQRWACRSITKKVTVIGNPVPEATLPLIRKNHDNVFVIIVVGRLDSLKSVDSVINAFRKAVAQFSELRLVICGDGPERQSLEALVHSYDLTDRVIFKGAVSTIETELSHADLLISSSKTEAFPMSICEAMAAGLFVISSRFNDSVSDFIDDGQNGFLFDVGDQQGLEKKLLYTLNNKTILESGGLLGQQKMRRFNPTTIASQWIQLFQRFVDENSIAYKKP